MVFWSYRSVNTFWGGIFRRRVNGRSPKVRSLGASDLATPMPVLVDKPKSRKTLVPDLGRVFKVIATPNESRFLVKLDA